MTTIGSRARTRDRARLDRRAFLQAAGVLGTTALLSACGGGGEGAAQSGRTRSLEGARGPVEIPAAPARIVCTDHYTPSALLDVGVEPIAVADFAPNFLLADYVPVYQRLPKVGRTNSADPEKVLSFQPDLVLGTLLPNAPDPSYDRFLAAVPTLYLPSRAAGDWRERAIAAADAVGRRSAAEELRDTFDRRAQEIRTTHADVLGRTRWSMVMGGRNPGQWTLALPDSWGGVVLAAAGIRFSDISQATGTVKDFSSEELGLLRDSDVIVVQGDNDGSTSDGVADVLASPVWNSLPAVAAGRAQPLPYFNTLHYRQGLAMLDRIEEIIRGV
ncbi:ABC transporter substrate-binding protein [Pseudonocardia tropica]|uniref:ABC transporter substrate-binding protein n=1 Tax=Pseudonocardia tropica TaxID=681289 RepID=A0ABV1JX59_9PSEU